MILKNINKSHKIINELIEDSSILDGYSTACSKYGILKYEDYITITIFGIIE